jgi:large subunit ribosomal protein L40e
MKLFVTSAYSQALFTIEISASSSIQELKALVQEKTQVPVNQQTLNYGCKVLLQENLTLQDYNLQKDATLFLSLKLRGGMNSKVGPAELLSNQEDAADSSVSQDNKQIVLTETKAVKQEDIQVSENKGKEKQYNNKIYAYADVLEDVKTRKNLLPEKYLYDGIEGIRKDLLKQDKERIEKLSGRVKKYHLKDIHEGNYISNPITYD